MANEENLKPFDKRTVNEQREIASKGGIASGKARRKKKEFREIISQALNSVIPNDEAQKKLEALGFDPTFQSAIALKVVELATKGDLRAVEALFSLEKDKKDSLDRKEQRERIKAMQLENGKRQQALAGDDKQEDALADYFDALREVKDNG